MAISVNFFHTEGEVIKPHAPCHSAEDAFSDVNK